MRLLIGVIASGFPIQVVPVEFWASYERLVARLRAEGPCGCTYYELTCSKSFPTDVARNQIVRYALARAFDAVLFLDADHVFEPTLFERLARHQKAVITARYHVKRPPFHANAYIAHPLAPAGHFKTVHYGRGCFEIDRGGAGALLVQRPVLEAIGTDWFRYQRNPTPGEPDDFTVSEDFWFYQRAQEEGFSCWVDWETEAQHLVSMAIGKEQNDVYLRELERVLTAELAQQLVVCGYDRPLQVTPEYAIEPFRREAYQSARAPAFSI